MARKGKPLTLTMPVPADTPANSRRAALIAEDLKKVGIVVKVRNVPADDFFSQFVIPLDFDLVTFVWRGSAFPIGARGAAVLPDRLAPELHRRPRRPVRQGLGRRERHAR